jgi:cytochrome P450
MPFVATLPQQRTDEARNGSNLNSVGRFDMKAADYHADLFSDLCIVNPYESYRQIRDLGPSVYMRHYDLYAVGRFADVKATLSDHKKFISGRGVAANPIANANRRGTTISSDSPTHEHLRRLIGAPCSHQRSRSCGSNLKLRQKSSSRALWPRVRLTASQISPDSCRCRSFPI